MVQLLLRNKADNKARDKGEKTPFQFARASPTFSRRQYNEVVQHLAMKCEESATNNQIIEAFDENV